MASCLICFLKPSLYFSSFCCSPTTLTCRHSSPTRKPSIKDSKIKRYIAYLLQSAAIVSGTIELRYRYVSTNFRDIQTVLSFSEYLMTLFVIAWIASSNRSWRLKLQELEDMVDVYEFSKKFGVRPEETGFYRSRYCICYGGIVWSLLVSATRFFSYVGSENGGMAGLHHLNSFFVGYLVSSFYIETWTDTTMYLGIFKKISSQIDKELKLRMRKHHFYGISPPATDSFCKKILKLRKLYSSVLASFRRTRLLLKSFMEYSTVCSYLQLIWLLFVFIMSMGDFVEFDYRRKLILMRIVGQIGFLYVWGYTCDQIENTVTEMGTLFFRFPSAKLNAEETRELEIFVKLLSWEKPMSGPKTNISFGISFLSGLTVNIVVNSMVLIQLYFFFGK